jgi:putative transposase
MFRLMLEYKADRNDSHVVAIGRFFASSKTCGACGWKREDLTLAMREWDCLNPKCGVHHDRDLNAARNIDHEGKRLFKLRVAAGHAETQNAIEHKSPCGCFCHAERSEASSTFARADPSLRSG